jgi:hypothetical protein
MIGKYAQKKLWTKFFHILIFKTDKLTWYITYCMSYFKILNPGLGWQDELIGEYEDEILKNKKVIKPAYIYI